MFLGYFSERPYQDADSPVLGENAQPQTDLRTSNRHYRPLIASELYHRYLDEKLAVEEAGFDGFMLNEHHNTPFTLGSSDMVEAAILARITKRSKIVLLGNILPIHDDPLYLAEMLAMVDVISRGRLVSGFVRGSGREMLAHNASPTYNWQRFQEAHDFIVKAWTTPGPFRWESECFQYRMVNPWALPYQKPHPPIWIPGRVSKSTTEWCAQHRYPYVMTATEEEPTKLSFDYYRECARENGYESGPQHNGYLIKVHVDESEELADETARKYLKGPSNPFLEGNQGKVLPYHANLPGLFSRTNLLPTQASRAAMAGQGLSPLGPDVKPGSYEDLRYKGSIITGTPATVLPKLRRILEYVRPGTMIFWDGDGMMTHEDAMRSIRLFGSEVLPRLREWAKELDLPGPFEVDPATNQRLDPAAAERVPELTPAGAGDD
jgi:alkanesulfonate monooxygenase SsuD/methylene tetrahydromethanopterin reductase-like flavin-dependent oxidoreductase (luciferase family)